MATNRPNGLSILYINAAERISTRSRLQIKSNAILTVLLFLIVAFFPLLSSASQYAATAQTYLPPQGFQYSFQERANHILTHNPLIDGHNDLMWMVRWLYKNKIYGDFKTKWYEGGLEGQVDIPRIEAGKYGGAFWSAFMVCPANVTDFSDENYAPIVRATLEQLDLYARLSSQYPRYFTPPASSLHAEQNFKKGLLISPIGIEGLHQIGNSLSTLRLYHALGVRYATLTWNCHNAYADAALISTSEGASVSKPLWHGVSPAGETLIEEMNRMGMLVDLSHVSADTMRDVLGISNKTGWKGSKAPVIFSHSSAYSVCPHPRNVPDDVLKAVKATDSLVMINFASDFISCVPSDSESELPSFYEKNNTLAQVVRHITYVGELIGYDHVGIGTDFDGIPSAPRGMEDVSKFPDLVAELLKQGVSDEDAAKVVGMNLLRVWRRADEVAQELQKSMLPVEDDISFDW